MSKTYITVCGNVILSDDMMDVAFFTEKREKKNQIWYIKVKF